MTTASVGRYVVGYVAVVPRSVCPSDLKGSHAGARSLVWQGFLRVNSFSKSPVGSPSRVHVELPVAAPPLGPCLSRDRRPANSTTPNLLPSDALPLLLPLAVVCSITSLVMDVDDLVPIAIKSGWPLVLLIVADTRHAFAPVEYPAVWRCSPSPLGMPRRGLHLQESARMGPS